jgi:hypothetical protein
LAGQTYAWETSEDLEIPEEPVFEEVPEPEALQEQPSPALPVDAPNEATAPESVQEPTDETAEEADPEAWRTWTVSDDLPSTNQKVEELLEHSQSFRRVFNDRVAKRAQQEVRGTVRDLQGKNEELEKRAIKAEAAMHKLFWQGKSEQERAAMFARDPNLIQAYQESQQVEQAYKEVQQRPEIPQYLRNTQTEVEDFVGSASLYLSETDFAAIQNYSRSAKFWTQFAQQPTAAIPHLKEMLDRRIIALQNTDVRTADTARASEPAQVAAQAPRKAPEVVRGNSKAGQYAPDSTARSGSGGGSARPVTDAELEAMDPDKYDAWLKSIGAPNSVAAKKMGYIKG